MIGTNCTAATKTPSDGIPLQCITADNYIGIFYDIELIRDVEKLNFNHSFQLAKDAGLQVMFSTSYTFPFKDDAQAEGWPHSLVPTMERIFKDPNVDIFAPQFYQDGFVVKDEEVKGVFGFDKWTELLQARLDNDIPTEVMPILKSKATDSAGIDADFHDQVKEFEAECRTHKNKEIFCHSDKYYLWTAN